jgi:predicted DNA-binding transcriptional regulator AlpA
MSSYEAAKNLIFLSVRARITHASGGKSMDDLDSVRVLKRPEALKVLGISDPTLKRLEAEGEAPPKTRLSPNRVGFRMSDLQKWLEARRISPAAA